MAGEPGQERMLRFIAKMKEVSERYPDRKDDDVKQRLMLLGVVDSQVETVSFGEEKPRATGSSEEAWAQNRRADLNYR